MLYTILKTIGKTASKGYFKTIEVNNRHFFPKKGPVILVANHQSSFMDSILLGAELDRELSFLARGEMFNTKLNRWAFGKMNMIPVYRKEKTPELSHQNEQILDHCSAHLQNDGAILIFPEGVSETTPRIKPLKSGAARIAFQAELENQFELGVQIVPVGINYTNPHQFQSSVSINIGEPISVNQYKKEYSEDSWDAVKQLTKTIETELQKLTIHIEAEPTNESVVELNKLLKTKNDSTQFTENQVKAIEPDLLIYKDLLQRFNLDIPAVESHFDQSRKGIGRIFSSVFLFTFPLFFLGFILNVIPYQITKRMALKITKRDDFLGSVTMMLGLGIFPITWAIKVFIIFCFTHNIFLALIVAFLLPILAWWTINNKLWLQELYHKISIKWFAITHPASYKALKNNRDILFQKIQLTTDNNAS